MSKRASSASGNDAKRAKRDLDQKVESIVGALADDTFPHDVPETARSVLAIGVRASLQSTVEERHVIQDEILGLARGTLNGMLEGLKSKAQEDRGKAESLSAQTAVLRTDLQILTAEVENTGSASDALAEKSAQSAQAHADKEMVVSEAESALSLLAKGRSKLEAEKGKHQDLSERLEKLIGGSNAAEAAAEAAAAADGEAEAKSEAQIEKERAKREKESQKALTKMVADFHKLGAESTLMVAVPNVLQKKPEERRGFDGLVVTGLRDFVADKVRGVDEHLSENAAETSKADEVLEGHRKALAGLTATKDADSEAAATAKSKHDEKVEGKAAKETAISDMEAEESNLKMAAEVADAKACDFEALMGTFSELCMRSSAPVLEEAAPEGEAAAEAALPAE